MVDSAPPTLLDVPPPAAERDEPPFAASRDEPRLSASRDEPPLEAVRAEPPPAAAAGALKQPVRAIWTARLPRARPARRRRFSTLTQRIILLNLLALIVLIGGALWVNGTRVGLIDERILSLTTQGRIIAGALAENATAGPEATGIEEDKAAPLLRRLVGPTDTRARLYDKAGELLLDTRYLLPENTIETNPLPPPGSGLSEPWATVAYLYGAAADALKMPRFPPYTEVLNGNGTLYWEVGRAIEGSIGSAVRVNDSGELILSVAVPVQRFQLVLGVLFMSTEGGDIDAVIAAERIALLQIGLLAFAVMIVSSIYLASTIARPVRALATAAETVRRVSTGRLEIPDFRHRRDEIGELSAALGEMTQGLYARIDAIEQFAADVAHEIKNPLTSLKSAVETFARARDDATRQRLIAVIAEDVNRINRLVSDISDASRLDAELARERALPVDLGRLIASLAQVYAPQDGKPAATVAVRIAAPPQGLVVDGLEGPLAQVFRNILDNAVSFSPPEATVRVNAAVEGDQVVVTIDDCGPGIPPENLARIFDRFFTERPAHHGFGRNSGLGLSISRQIIDVHRGQIWAENRTDAHGRVLGARFGVALPAAPP